MQCRNCTKYDDCHTGSGLWQPCGAYVPVVITNAEHIRSMTDEKMARERIQFEYNPNGPDMYVGDFGAVCVKYIAGVEQKESYDEAYQKELAWLKQPWRSKE